MSNRHWMPLDIGDYLKDTGHLTATEHGAYLLLIMRYWSDGGLPDDERMVARYSRMTPEQWVESRDVLAAFFSAGWKHGRIDAEIAKAEELIGKRRDAANQRHSKSNAHAEQVQSNSSDTGVPPSPSPKVVSSLRSDSRREGVHPDFEPWYATYPHKVQRGAAERAFLNARKLAGLDDLIDGVRRYVESKPPDRQWLNPASWLNSKAWLDAPATVQARASPTRELDNLIDSLVTDMDRADANAPTQIERHPAPPLRISSH